MELDTSKWKVFKLSDYFLIKKSKNINSDDLSKGNIPYVTRTALNNGVDGFVAKEDYILNKGNALIIGGESAYAFYQPEDFLTGNNITVLYSDFLNKYIGLFLVTILNTEHYRYSYGRAWNKGCVENTHIKLPATPNGDPDWEWMENYIKSLLEREREFWTCSEISKYKYAWSWY